MEDTKYFQSIKSIPKELIFDAILVLGGGVPEDISNPPSYTKERCKLAASIYSSSIPKPKILTLSAGTAHLPQALSADGLPIWESTASAAYLINHLNVKSSDVFSETTSYDTISNAFFARLNFCDIAKWKKLLIITNEFHMERTKLIFDWIFHAPKSDTDCNNDVNSSNYELYYLPAPDKGLTKEAIQARKKKESKSASTVKNILSQKYNSIEKVFDFLTTEHSFYTASKLVERGMDDGSDQDAVSQLVQDSYGGVSIQGKVIGQGKSTSSRLTFINGILLGIGLTTLMIMFGRRTKPSARGKRHPY